MYGLHVEGCKRPEAVGSDPYSCQWPHVHFGEWIPPCPDRAGWREHLLPLFMLTARVDRRSAVNDMT